MFLPVRQAVARLMFAHSALVAGRSIKVPPPKSVTQGKGHPRYGTAHPHKHRPRMHTQLTVQTTINHLTRFERKRVKASKLDMLNTTPRAVMETVYPGGHMPSCWAQFHRRTDGRYRGQVL